MHYSKVLIKNNVYIHNVTMLQITGIVLNGGKLWQCFSLVD